MAKISDQLNIYFLDVLGWYYAIFLALHPFACRDSRCQWRIRYSLHKSDKLKALKKRLFKLISKLHLHYSILDVFLCAPKNLAITTESKGFSFTLKLPGKVYNYLRGGYSKLTKQIAPPCLFYFLHPPTSKDIFFLLFLL